MGDRSDALYIIRSGKVSLFIDGHDGPVELARMGPGQIVGDLAFFTGSPRTAHAQALSDVSCLDIPYEVVAKQFEYGPPWVRTMMQTLANQVKDYSSEIRQLSDPEGGSLSKLVVARGWAALTFVSTQFGQRDGETLAIDWAKMRTYSNLCFREISSGVLQLARVLESIGGCTIQSDRNGPTELLLHDRKLLIGFLEYYVRAVSKNSPEISKIDPFVFEILQLLSNGDIQQTPIHRGQVEIDLPEFTRLAQKAGLRDFAATSIDLLPKFGLDIMKICTETCVKLRFHREEVINVAQYWRVLQAIQRVNQSQTLKSVG